MAQPGVDKTMLDHLVNRQGVCILYTQPWKDKKQNRDDLARVRGKPWSFWPVFTGPQDISYHNTPLLNYCRAVREVTFSASAQRNGLMIDVNIGNRKEGEHLGPVDLNGLSFYVKGSGKTTVTLMALTSWT